MRCFNFFSPQRNFSKESQLETEKVWWGEGVPPCVLNFLSLWTTLMGVKGPWGRTPELAWLLCFWRGGNTELHGFLGIVYKLSVHARAKVSAFALLLIFFWKKCLSLLLENWFDLGIAFAVLFCTYPKEVRPCRPIAIWTLQTSSGVLQLEKQPKIKQLAHCYQASWETVLMYQAWWAVKCFPSFNCRCVCASGNCKPRGTSVWVLVFLTEQNKYLTGLWMSKVRAHLTHEKLIYFLPKEKVKKTKPKITLLNKWAS